ncbi:MAG: hypothetical protein ABSG15_15740, partial [FCB group bacterium]
MRNLKFIILAALVVAISIGISSCQKDTPITSENTSNVTGDTYLPPQNNAPGILQEATLDVQMGVIPPQDGYLYQYRDANGNNCPNPDATMGLNDMGIFNMSRLFRKLKISQDTIALIKPLIQSYNDCMKAAMQTLRDSEKEIIQNANTERQSIIAEFKANTITKDSARHALMILNKTTRDSLKNNPARVTACEAMQACKQTLFDSIRALLNDAQKVIWDAWV